MTPYDMHRLPSKQYWFLMPLIWGASWVMTRQFHLKIDKSQIKKLKPPYLVIATHQGFSDYYIGPLTMFPHRAMYVSDINVVKNIKYGLSKGQSVVIYPESRHSNIGTTAYIPENMGKLAKIMNVPVVILSAHGSYLANPFWDEEHTRKVPIKVKAECLCTKDEIKNISAQELQSKIEKALQYDEYRYQQENNILIKIKSNRFGENDGKTHYFMDT